MRARPLTLSVFLACTTILGAAESGGYLNFDAGYNLANDLDVRAEGPEDATVAVGTFDLKPGFRFSIVQGFILNRFMALELETGFIYNTIDAPQVQEFDAWYGHVPLMLSAVFRYEFDNGLTPFVGIGGGGTASIFDLSVTAGDTEINEANVNFVLAGQAMAGLRYQINDNISLGVVYKFLATTTSKYEIRDLEFNFDPVRNHYFGAQLILSF